MMIQLIYWKALCTGCRSAANAPKAYTGHSVDEMAAFKRSLRRHKENRFIRYH
ncbi:MAG: hypothetical protein H6959_06760 [Chromatiaceae bacterium]|nr:hypothetical protein [Gammaproteobacteria bacterium]MCP5300530.1 hypothetical protein [Chromatiaceae bacterium]MCP5422602.1 hypothetical protein [Chromatiaceae bacterium]